jgi:hypothetical protein
VSWLRMEPPEDPSDAAELRLTSWPGGDRVIGRTGYHGHPVWAGDAPQPG